MTIGAPDCKTITPIIDVARFLIENNVKEIDYESQMVSPRFTFN